MKSTSAAGSIATGSTRRQRPSRSPQAIQMSAGASARPTGRVSTPSAPSTEAQKKRLRSASRNVPVASTRKRLSA